MASVRSLLSVDLRRLWLNPRLTLPDNSPIDLGMLSGQPPFRGVAKMSADRDSEAEELPPPSPELVLIRVFVESFLQTAPPEQAQAFMDAATSILADEATASLVIPIRAKPQYGRTAKARREAVAHFRALRSVLMARVPPA